MRRTTIITIFLGLLSIIALAYLYSTAQHTLEENKRKANEQIGVTSLEHIHT